MAVQSPSNSIAHFRNNVLIDGILQGQTILRLDNERNSVLNSLNAHISNYNSSESSNQTARDNLQTQINDNNDTLTSMVNNLFQVVDANKTNIEGALATETSNRLTAISDLNTTISTRNTYVDGEISRLDGLHQSDSERLTTIENELKTRDNDIDQKISDAVVLEQKRFDNQEPRLQKLEQFFVIDDATQTITLKNYKIIIEGDLEQGTGSSSPPPPPDNSPENPDPAPSGAPSQNLSDYVWVSDGEGAYQDIIFYNNDIAYFQSNPIAFGSIPTQVQLDEIQNYFGSGGTIDELYAGQGESNKIKLIPPP